MTVSGWMARLRRRRLPCRCLVCDARIEGAGGLCSQCWDGIHFFHAPCCRERRDCDRESPMAARRGRNRIRSAMLYQGAAASLVARFKYGRRAADGPVFARWMMRVGADILRDADLLVPVPMHPDRLRRRGFNQSERLAVLVARLSGVPAQGDVCRRVREGRLQAELPLSRRRANVEGAFRLRERRRGRLAGRNLVVVDDVITSGATADVLAECLKRAGAGRVDVLTLAQAAHPDIPLPS